MKPILVTSYTGPDLDGLACMMAYAEFLEKKGQNAEAGLFGTPHDEAQFVMQRFGFKYPKTLAPAKDYDQIVLVDSADIEGLEESIEPAKVIEIIDHHKVNQAHLFPQAKVQLEFVGAAATLVAEKFKQSKTSLSKQSATLLYGAIFSNTLNLKGNVTTDRDKAMATWLESQIDETIFVRDMFLAKSDFSGDRLASTIKGDGKARTTAGKVVAIAQIEMIGGEELVKSRKEELFAILNELLKEKQFDFLFLSVVDIEAGQNIFVSTHAPTKKLLEKVLGVTFAGGIAVRDGLILRKEIGPLIKDELEKSQ